MSAGVRSISIYKARLTLSPVLKPKLSQSLFKTLDKILSQIELLPYPAAAIKQLIFSLVNTATLPSVTIGGTCSGLLCQFGIKTSGLRLAACFSCGVNSCAGVSLAGCSFVSFSIFLKFSWCSSSSAFFSLACCTGVNKSLVLISLRASCVFNSFSRKSICTLYSFNIACSCSLSSGSNCLKILL